jgi:hypothetical protein
VFWMRHLSNQPREVMVIGGIPDWIDEAQAERRCGCSGGCLGSRKGVEGVGGTAELRWVGMGWE